MEPPSEDAKTLFVAGLPSVVLQEDILALFKGSVAYRPAFGRSYAFVEFDTHANAAMCMDAVKYSHRVDEGETKGDVGGSRGDYMCAYMYRERALYVGWAESEVNQLPDDVNR
jgi:hypothetical protein